MKARVLIVVTSTALAALLCGDAFAGKKKPALKLTEKAVSAFRCTTAAGETSCGVRTSAKVQIITSVAVAPGTLPPDTQFTITIGRSAWTAPLSADPAYAPGAKRAVLTLAKDADTSKPTIVATLKWTKAAVKVSVAATTPVTSEDFVEDPSAGAGAVDRPLRACVQIGSARADFGIRVRGRQFSTKHTTPSDEGSETELMPQASLSGKGFADGRTGPPDLAAKIERVQASGPPERSPDVAVSGVAVSGGTIQRITTQLDSAAEVDVTPGSVIAFPCGGAQSSFAATVHFRDGKRHVVTVRAYDDQSRTASASAAFTYDGPTAFPKIVRLVPLGRLLSSVHDAWTVMGMIDDTGRLWIQAATGRIEDDSPVVRLQPSATPAGLEHVVDVHDYVVDIHGPNDTVDRVEWIAVHDDGTVSVQGKTVAGISSVKAIAWEAGYGYPSGLALTNDGHVYSWGGNFRGELGDTSFPARDAPAQVAGLSNVVRIATGSDRERFALTSDGTLYAWGEDTELLRGASGGDFHTPAVVPTASPVADFVTDSGGYRLFIAHTDGTVTGRGAASVFSYLGNGAASNTSAGDFFPATKVQSLAGITLLRRDGRTYTDNTMFAIRGADGALSAWGDNADASCGLDVTTAVVTPTLVTGPSGVADVKVWNESVVARTSGGEVWGWGAYDIRKYAQSQAGGVGTASRTPVQVPGVADVVQIEELYQYAFALTAGGRVFFWRTIDASYAPQELLFYEK